MGWSALVAARNGSRLTAETNNPRPLNDPREQAFRHSSQGNRVNERFTDDW